MERFVIIINGWKPLIRSQISEAVNYKENYLTIKKLRHIYFPCKFPRFSEVFWIVFSKIISIGRAIFMANIKSPILTHLISL